MRRADPDWPRLLAPGETLIWHGRPQARPPLPTYRRSRTGMAIAAMFVPFGLFLSWFTETTTHPPATEGARLAAHGFAACFVLGGLAVLWHAVVAPVWHFRRLAYALTDRASLIHDGHMLRRWPIGAPMRLSRRPGPGASGSVVFAHEDSHYFDGLRLVPVPVGFFNIAGADAVQAAMQAQIDAHDRRLG